MVRIRYSAPGRCGILGNPSDIYGGAVLACSINARNHCELVLDDDAAIEDEFLWRAATRRLPLARTACIRYASEVPRSSGLAGSTAALAALVACLLDARGTPADLASTEGRAAHAELVRDIERVEAGVMCGFQDAYMVVFGGLNAMRFPGKRPDVNGGPLAEVVPLAVPAPFLLVTTGVERLSGSVHGPMAQRWLEGDPDVVETMRWLTDAVPTGHDALLRGDWPTLAGLMQENQTRIAALGGSGEPIDDLVAACLAEGALAAKLAGAGMGGTVIALTLDPAELEARLRERGYTRFLRAMPQEGLRREPVG